MVPEPLHPAVVHFPIVFACVLPVVAIVLWLRIRRDSGTAPSWVWVFLSAALLAGSSWAAVQTGEAEEDRVEAVVSEAAIHDHEESAERFLLITGAFLVLTSLGLVRGAVGRAARPVAAAASIVLPVAALVVGGSGGDLVYTHGAAEAYRADGAAEVYETGSVAEARETRGES